MSEKISISGLSFDDRGLICAIVQDWDTGEVLMQAYMNEESVGRTLDTGRTWFWSRSRQKLWNKGETSGHIQTVKQMRYDCDQDCLLILVEQTGAACHTGEKTCFYRSMAGGEITPANFEVLSRLGDLIGQRKSEMPSGSYTVELFEKGTDTILKKVGEESAELIVAAKGGEKIEITHEAADLFFHVTVLLAQTGVEMVDVMEELRKRWK